MQPPRFAIFDLDGTLIDTEPCYTQATQEIVARFGREFPWELKAQMMGKPAKVSAQLLVDTLQLPISADEYLAERKPRILELTSQAPDLPGAAALLDALAARGLPIAIATSSQRALAERKLHGRSWGHHMQVVICGDDAEVANPKPAPDIFLEAAARLGAVPADSLVFEDSPTGMEAGVAAGMRLVAVPDTRLDRSRIPAGAIVLDTLEGLSLSTLGL